LPVNTLPSLTGTEIPLSGWTRCLCETSEYPAFDEPEPVVLPDTLEKLPPGFSGFVCYETVFVLDSPKPLLLEIFDTAGSVEVYMNGETAGLQNFPPYHYDLSNLARQGKNYLAIEVAVIMERDDMTDEASPLEKTHHDKHITSPPYIIGAARLYTT
jgi:hypothetical protein